MRYRESREHSAELLRLVLPLMARQKAGFHPASYTLWYEHVAGINPSLSQVLEQRLQAQADLNDDDVLRLYAQHVIDRDVRMIERIQQRLAAVLEEASRVVSDTGTHATHFGAALEAHSTRLRALPADVEVIFKIANELLVETQRMCAASVSLSRQLDLSVQEVQTLTHRLQEVQAEAYRDPLTRLLNRRGFELAVADLLAQGGDLHGAAMLVVDVDHFKRINDTHGHLAGDQVLRAVAQVLRARVKGADIAARFGGDEFAVLLPETAMCGARALAEKIRTTVPQGRLRRLDRQACIENVTLSVGVSHGRIGGNLEELLQRADAALYEAKRAGRNCVSSGPGAELETPN